MSNLSKVAVLGGGSFGTVLANIAASNGNKVALWVRDSDQALRINSEGANSTYHPELQLSSNIQASECLEDVMKDSNIVLIATPSIIFENIVQRIVPMIELQASVISCTKGIKLNPFRSMSDIISENIDTNINNVGVLKTQARLEDISYERFKTILEINVLSCFLCTQAAIKSMSTRHGGAGGPDRVSDWRQVAATCHGRRGQGD